jgi:hypothetical protein
VADKLKISAQELKNSDALEMILAEMQQDILGMFEGTPKDELFALQCDFKAIGRLRSTIGSKLVTYLETA